jgi:hypothetical protein
MRSVKSIPATARKAPWNTKPRPLELLLDPSSSVSEGLDRSAASTLRIEPEERPLPSALANGTTSHLVRVNAVAAAVTSKPKWL